jgi:Zn-dependent protease with chaperone function
MPSPVAEASLVVLAAVVIGWVVTYLVHSTVAITCASVLTGVRRCTPRDRVRIWRFALVAPFATATVQMLGMAGSPFATDLAETLPQSFVDWRVGVVAVAFLTVAVGSLLVTFVAGAILRRRLLGRRRRAAGHLQEEAALLSARLGAPRPTVTLSDTSSVPAAVGYAEVCIPSFVVAGMPLSERYALLGHEVAHLAARDPLWFSVIGSLTALVPFQFLNRWAIVRLREAAEQAADETAVGVTGNPEALALALTGLVSRLWIVQGGATATGSPVVERVERLIGARPSERALTRPLRWGLAAVALAALIVAAPGIVVSPEAVANRLPWLTPSKAEPNARMLELRQHDRAWRDFFRRNF